MRYCASDEPGKTGSPADFRGYYSALAAFGSKKNADSGIPYGGRQSLYDDRVPEEINRRVIDHCSDISMPYTERSRANLLKEGIDGKRIYVTGNPIKEVLTYHADRIEQSKVLQTLGLFDFV